MENDPKILKSREIELRNKSSIVKENFNDLLRGGFGVFDILQLVVCKK